jgi:hypothetical protein
MTDIPLSDTIDALRTELSAAIAKGADADVQFPVGAIQLEFNVSVTKSADVKGGVRFWVVDAGTGGSIASSAVQKVTIALEAPVDRAGRPVKVTGSLGYQP